MIRNSREDAEQLLRWVAEGKVEVVIEEVFEFEKVKEAFEKLKSGKCYGKLVVKVGK
jgi:D-arabinose 1-dehydrogenase-like Zn-dependent alcohol dehydrogenase